MLQIRLFFIVAGVVVGWSGLHTVASDRGEKRKNRSASWGSPFPVMRLEACDNAGETITPRFLLGILIPLASLPVYLVCIIDS